VVALFSIIHLPLEAQQRLINRVSEWLRPGGVFMFVGGGAVGWSGAKLNWHGVRMYWWQAPASDYVRWISEAGFELEECEVSDRGDHGHSLIVGRRHD